MEIFQKNLLIPHFYHQKRIKRVKKGRQPGAGCSPLMGLLHLGLVAVCFVGKAREGIQSRCIGIEDGKVRRGNAVALGR